jgi:hypothetical protein
MRNQRIWLLAAVSAVAFGWASPAWVTPPGHSGGGGSIVTSLLLPLQGIFRLPTDPCVPAGEDVALAGEVHVVTKTEPSIIRQIHLNMAGVDGVGQTSGSTYIGTGSNKFVDLPSDPCISVQANFTLETTNGCASVPLPVTATLCFAKDGTLLPSPQSTVSVGGVT